MKIITRSEEEIVFDTSKIVAAITRSIDTEEERKRREERRKHLVNMIDLFVGVDAMIDELIDNMTQAFMTLAHALMHMIMHGFDTIREGVRRLRSTKHVLVCYPVFTISACIQHLTLAYLENSHIFREAVLFRSQDRGNNNSDNDNDNHLTIRDLRAIIIKEEGVQHDYSRRIYCGQHGRGLRAICNFS